MAIKTKQADLKQENIYTPDYDKWKNKEEWEQAKFVNDRFESMRLNRQNSCYWGAGAGELSNWNDRWSRDEKQMIMWRADMDEDDPRSNLKSVMTWGSVQAVISEFEDGKIKPTVRWVEEEDKPKAIIKEQCHIFAQEKNKFDQEYSDGFMRFVEKGTVVFYTTYLIKKREVQVFERDPAKMSDEEKKELKEKKKPVLKKKVKVDYDDIAVMPVRVEEFYIDENARCFRGKAFEAIDCCWVTPMTIQQIKDEWEDCDDPFVKKANIKKVKAIKDYNADEGFFQPPSDMDGNQCSVFRYYNKATDSYIVVANDVVLRDGPNPHPHKELPFVVKSCFPFLDHVYGISFPAILEGLQSEEETIRNMFLDQLKQIVNPPALVQEDIYGQFCDMYPRMEAGMRVPARDINNAVAWMQRSQPVYEVDSTLNRLKDEGVIASGIDPRAQGLTVKNATATDAMLNKEATQKIMKKIIKRFIEAVQEVWQLLDAEMNSHYPVGRVEDIVDEKGQRKRNVLKKIRIKNKKFNYGKDGLEVKEIKGYSSFALKKEFFDFEEQVDIYIDPEAVVNVSQGLEMRKYEQAIADLTPFMGDPSAIPPGQPKPIVDVNEIIRGYLETHDIPEKAMVQDELNQEEEIDRAIEQNQQMQKGKYISGLPGEPTVHKLVHKTELEQINNLVNNPPAMMQMVELEMLRAYQQLLARHLMTDDLNYGMSTQAAVAQAMPQMAQAGAGPAQSGPAMGPAGGMGGQPGSPMGGTQAPSQQDVYGVSKPQPQMGVY